MSNRWWRHLRVSFLSLALTLTLFTWTNLDLQVQSLLFQHGHWLWSKTEPVARLFFYQGPKLALQSLFVILILLLCCRPWSQKIKRHTRKIALLALSLALVPLSVNGLKASTHMACPYQLAPYGGDLPYVDLFTSNTSQSTSEATLRCFPAGHASGGFALLALMFVFDSHRGKQCGLALALTLGWLMALYKMAIGDHFLSHTLVSMELAYFITGSLSLMMLPGIPRENGITQSAQAKEQDESQYSGKNKANSWESLQSATGS